MKDLIKTQEIMKRVKVTRRTLQIYREMGLIPEPVKKIRMKGGGVVALFPASIVDRIKEIRVMQDQQKTLNEIKDFFVKREAPANVTLQPIPTGQFTAYSANSTGPTITLG